MKRSVQILLLLATLLPLLAVAKDETMEERKRRITRKYLHERIELTESEMVVPDTAAENEQVLDSEQYRQPEVDLQRQETSAARRPPPRRPMPRTENRNWLLAEPTKNETDPYADPFAIDPTGTDLNTPSEWMSWGQDDAPSSSASPQRERGYTRRDDDASSGYNSTRQSFFNPRDPYSAERTKSIYPSSSTIFGGQNQEDPKNGLDLSNEKTFNSALNPTHLQSPFQTPTRPSSNRSFESDSQSRKGSYTPYQSAYQKQLEQQREQRGRYTQPEPKEYQRKNRFEQWKQKNSTQFDPTSDDAFIDEMMPKVRK